VSLEKLIVVGLKVISGKRINPTHFGDGPELSDLTSRNGVAHKGRKVMCRNSPINQSPLKTRKKQTYQ